MVLSIPAILAQMPPATVATLPADVEAMVVELVGLHTKPAPAPLPRGAIIIYDERGWVVTVDGITDPAMPGRQAGSRGGWPSMRHALLAAILLAVRPELPIKGV